MQPLPKFRVLIEAPCMNRSGYGQWADSLVPMFIRYPGFDTKVTLAPWGNCVPRSVPGPNDALIIAHLLPQAELNAIRSGASPRCDIFVSMNLPGNAQPVGRIFNINVTAGLEVDRLPDYMAAAANRWDLSILMSQFSKQVYLNSAIKPTKALEVLPWAQDLSIFNPAQSSVNPKIEALMASVSEPEAFLYVGQMTHHVPNLDRKNVVALIRAFSTAFAGKEKKPALILKTSGTSFSTFNRRRTIAAIQYAKATDPSIPIYLLHGELSDQEFASLYKHPKIIACVSATRGEGLGGSLLQSTLCGKPAITSDYGGHLEYLDPDRAMLVPGSLVEIPTGAESVYYLKGSKWFEIDQTRLAEAMSAFFHSPHRGELHDAAGLAKHAAWKFSPENVEKQLHAMLDKYLFGK